MTAALALLLVGPKSRRAEFAITEGMDAAIKAEQEASGSNRSDACRMIMARGIMSRERDITEQPRHGE